MRPKNGSVYGNNCNVLPKYCSVYLCYTVSVVAPWDPIYICLSMWALATGIWFICRGCQRLPTFVFLKCVVWICSVLCGTYCYIDCYIDLWPSISKGSYMMLLRFLVLVPKISSTWRRNRKWCGHHHAWQPFLVQLKKPDIHFYNWVPPARL